MVPGLSYTISAERTRDMRLAADRARLASAAAHDRASGSPRQRLGRRLISLGLRLAGDR